MLSPDNPLQKKDKKPDQSSKVESAEDLLSEENEHYRKAQELYENGETILDHVINKGFVEAEMKQALDYLHAALSSINKVLDSINKTRPNTNNRKVNELKMLLHHKIALIYAASYGKDFEEAKPHYLEAIKYAELNENFPIQISCNLAFGNNFLACASKIMEDKTQASPDDELDRAIEYYDKVLKLIPTHHEAHLMKQLCRSKKKSNHVGISEQEIKIEQMRSHIEIGFIFFNQFPTALFHFESAIRLGLNLDRQNDVMYLKAVLSILYFNNGTKTNPADKKTMIEYYDKAIKEIDDVRKNRPELALSYFQQARYIIIKHSLSPNLEEKDLIALEHLILTGIEKYKLSKEVLQLSSEINFIRLFEFDARQIVLNLIENLKNFIILLTSNNQYENVIRLNNLLIEFYKNTNPSDDLAAIYASTALCYMKLKSSDVNNVHMAIKFYTKAIENGTNEKLLKAYLVARGMAYKEIKQIKEGEKDLKLAHVQIKEETPSSLICDAIDLSLNKDMSNLKTQIHAAIKLYRERQGSGYYDCKNDLDTATQSIKMRIEKIKEANNSIEIIPELIRFCGETDCEPSMVVDLYCILGQQYHKKRDYANALMRYTIVIDSGVAACEGHYYRAMAYFDLGELNKAKLDCEYILKLPNLKEFPEILEKKRLAKELLDKIQKKEIEINKKLANKKKERYKKKVQEAKAKVQQEKNESLLAEIDPFVVAIKKISIEINIIYDEIKSTIEKVENTPNAASFVKQAKITLGEAKTSRDVVTNQVNSSNLLLSQIKKENQCSDIPAQWKAIKSKNDNVNKHFEKMKKLKQEANDILINAAREHHEYVEKQKRELEAKQEKQHEALLIEPKKQAKRKKKGKLKKIKGKTDPCQNELESKTNVDAERLEQQKEASEKQSKITLKKLEKRLKKVLLNSIPLYILNQLYELSKQIKEKTNEKLYLNGSRLFKVGLGALARTMRAENEKIAKFFQIYTDDTDFYVNSLNPQNSKNSLTAEEILQSFSFCEDLKKQSEQDDESEEEAKEYKFISKKPNPLYTNYSLEIPLEESEIPFCIDATVRYPGYLKPKNDLIPLAAIKGYFDDKPDPALVSICFAQNRYLIIDDQHQALTKALNEGIYEFNLPDPTDSDAYLVTCVFARAFGFYFKMQNEGKPILRPGTSALKIVESKGEWAHHYFSKYFFVTKNPLPCYQEMLQLLRKKHFIKKELTSTIQAFCNVAVLEKYYQNNELVKEYVKTGDYSRLAPFCEENFINQRAKNMAELLQAFYEKHSEDAELSLSTLQSLMDYLLKSKDIELTTKPLTRQTDWIRQLENELQKIKTKEQKREEDPMINELPQPWPKENNHFAQLYMMQPINQGPFWPMNVLQSSFQGMIQMPVVNSPPHYPPVLIPNGMPVCFSYGPPPIPYTDPRMRWNNIPSPTEMQTVPLQPNHLLSEGGYDPRLLSAPTRSLPPMSPPINSSGKFILK